MLNCSFKSSSGDNDYIPLNTETCAPPTPESSTNRVQYRGPHPSVAPPERYKITTCPTREKRYLFKTNYWTHARYSDLTGTARGGVIRHHVDKTNEKSGISFSYAKKYSAQTAVTLWGCWSTHNLRKDICARRLRDRNRCGSRLRTEPDYMRKSGYCWWNCLNRVGLSPKHTDKLMFLNLSEPLINSA